MITPIYIVQDSCENMTCETVGTITNCICNDVIDWVFVIEVVAVGLIICAIIVWWIDRS